MSIFTYLRSKVFGGSKKASNTQDGSAAEGHLQNGNVEAPADAPVTREKSIWSTIACGSGLFSDGYLNNVIGSVSTVLGVIYGPAFSQSSARKNISSITFAGILIGMLLFGYTTDKWSRKNSLFASTLVLIVFAALGAGAYGVGGSPQSMFMALTAYRFLVGIGIGGEYPAGSVACSESTSGLKKGTRNRMFIMFTNVMLDWGFVFGSFVPYVLVVICGPDNLSPVWRLALGLGIAVPIVLLLLRLKVDEPEEFKRESMKHAKIPYKLVIKFYWRCLAATSLIWFLYDFSSYSFSIHSPTILSKVYGRSDGKPAPLTKVFGWNTVITLFYIPGAMLGAFYSDLVGPRMALASGVAAQSAVGFIMSGLYSKLARPENVGVFALVYGVFISLGELGPGDNVGIFASKTCATGVRGQYYSVAASIGKLGAFVGTFVFPYISAAGGQGDAQYQYPFYVSSVLCALTACVACFGLPDVTQDSIAEEDRRFREYLTACGWDTKQLGTMQGESPEGRAEAAGIEMPELTR